MKKSITKQILAAILALVVTMSLFSNVYAACYCDSRASGYGYVITTSTNGSNVRRGPGTNYAKVGAVPGGVALYTSERRGNWAKIRTGVYDGYWICTTYTVNAQWSRKTVQVTARSGLNLRRGPSTSFGIIRTISYGTVLTSVYQCTNGWYYVSNGNYSGWVSGSY